MERGPVVSAGLFLLPLRGAVFTLLRVSRCCVLLLLQVCELLVAGLPLKSDGVESQKVNDMLVRMAEVRHGRQLVGNSKGLCISTCLHHLPLYPTKNHF